MVLSSTCLSIWLCMWKQTKSASKDISCSGCDRFFDGLCLFHWFSKIHGPVAPRPVWYRHAQRFFLIFAIKNIDICDCYFVNTEKQHSMSRREAGLIQQLMLTPHSVHRDHQSSVSTIIYNLINVKPILLCIAPYKSNATNRSWMTENVSRKHLKFALCLNITLRLWAIIWFLVKTKMKYFTCPALYHKTSSQTCVLKCNAVKKFKQETHQ